MDAILIYICVCRCAGNVNCYFYPSYRALGTYRAGRQLHIIEQFGSVTIFASDAYRYIAGIVYLSEMA